MPKMTFAQIFGWVLLLLGLAIIIYPLYSSYQIFTAEKPAPEIFVSQTISLPQEKQAQGLEGQMEQMLQEQLQGVLGQMLPANSLTTMLNLAAWSIFAGILIFGGSKISGLGIRLLLTRKK